MKVITNVVLKIWWMDEWMGGCKSHFTAIKNDFHKMLVKNLIVRIQEKRNFLH